MNRDSIMMVRRVGDFLLVLFLLLGWKFNDGGC